MLWLGRSRGICSEPCIDVSEDSVWWLHEQYLTMIVRHIVSIWRLLRNNMEKFQRITGNMSYNYLRLDQEPVLRNHRRADRQGINSAAVLSTLYPCLFWWEVAACFALHFLCVIRGSLVPPLLCPVFLSSSPELLSVFLSTLELSYFDFDSKPNLKDFWYI
jgi:hypothetical protein